MRIAPAGRSPTQRALLTLLQGADALVENFKPGTTEAWGLSIQISPSVFRDSFTAAFRGSAAMGLSAICLDMTPRCRPMLV
jgi:hypothetical protein